MVETVASAAVTGLEVRRVRVEVSITRGTPLIQIVGLAQSAVREGRERIRAAASALGLHVPGLRITVNLAPADVPKHGAAFDLPMTIGILAAAGQLPGRRARRYAMAGELGLDGSLRPIRGALPIALHAAAAGDVDGLLLPRANLREARPAEGIDVRGAATLDEAIGFLRGGRELPRPRDLPPRDAGAPGEGGPDLASVRGQEAAKRALEIAAAGAHNVLLTGPPGAGKTSLARCLPGLLPPLSRREAVEVTAVHSVAGRLPADAGLVDRRPFRAPHHTVSEAGLIGGGGIPRPGEASLAHRGVLFLDELPEFGRGALEALRQPLEEGVVHVVRARASASFPARFTLVAAMNPCPCGHAGGEEDRCTCEPGAVARYRHRVSGPLLDRIDLQVEVPAVTWDDLEEKPAGEGSEAVRARVIEARARAAARWRERTAPTTCAVRDGAGARSGPAAAAGSPGVPAPAGAPPVNAELGAEELEAWCVPDGDGRWLLRRAMERFGLTARGYHRTLRVARTVADLEGSERVRGDHVAQALRYRGAVGAG